MSIQVGSRAGHPTLAHRVTTLLASGGIFTGAFKSWNTIIQLPWTGVVCVTSMMGIIALSVLTLAVRQKKSLVRVDIWVLLLGLFVLIGWSVSSLYFQSGYGTDEAAFIQYAAQLLLNGHNPYGVDLLPALSEFRVPIQYSTATMDGRIVSTLSYPPFSVLLTAILVPLTGGVQTIIVATTISLAVTTVLMFVLMPHQWRSLAVLVCISLPVIFDYTMEGMNAVIAIPLLVAVAHRWTRTGQGGRLSGGDVVRAVCLGLAAATQPLCWFVVPFMLAGILLLRMGELASCRAWQVTLRYTAIAGAVFIVVNLPFIIWGPRVWLNSVAEPLTQSAIPYGQGLIDLAIFFNIGGGSLIWYNFMAACVGLAVFTLYLLHFPRLGPACFVLPWFVFFFPTRSLAAYFIIFLPVWVVSFITVNRQDFTQARRLEWSSQLQSHPARKWAVVALVFVPVITCAVPAVATPQPLRIQIVGLITNGQLQSVWQLRLKVSNTVGYPLYPYFATNYIGQASTFWNVISGPKELVPRSTAEYIVAAPNGGSMPGLTTPFLVQAVTAQPKTISSSELFTPQPYAAVINPPFINDPQRPGSCVTLSVRLRSPFGGYVARSGVEIALGQLIYGQEALIAAEASINDGPPGQSPAMAKTDAQGVAVFHVCVDHPQKYPIYFQAWVSEPDGYPYGYSEIVSVLWLS